MAAVGCWTNQPTNRTNCNQATNEICRQTNQQQQQQQNMQIEQTSQPAEQSVTKQPTKYANK